MDPAVIKGLLEAGNLGVVLILILKVIPWMMNRMERSAKDQTSAFSELVNAQLSAYKTELARDRVDFSREIHQTGRSVIRYQEEVSKQSAEHTNLLKKGLESLELVLKENTAATIKQSETLRSVSCLKP